MNGAIVINEESKLSRILMARDAGSEATAVAGAMTSMKIDELISNLAIGIARGQFELDQVSMELAAFMGEAQVQFGTKPGTGEPQILSLLELGFTPNFYQFVDTILEVRIAIKSEFEEQRSRGTSTTDKFIDSKSDNKSYENYNSSYDRSSSHSGSSGGLMGAIFGGKKKGKSSVSMDYDRTKTKTSSSTKQKSVSVTSVDANYSSKYNFSVEGSSLIKTKIVPVPPPTVLEELVRGLAEERRQLETQVRLIEQTIAIIPEIEVDVQNLKTEISSISIPTSVGDAAVANTLLDNSSKLNDKVVLWSDSFGRLTTDHWVVISDLTTRGSLDSALSDSLAKAKEMVDNAGAIVKIFDADTPNTEEVTKLMSIIGGTNGHKTKISANLSTFATKLTQMKNRFADKVEILMKRLEPPAEEAPTGEVLSTYDAGSYKSNAPTSSPSPSPSPGGGTT